MGSSRSARRDASRSRRVHQSMAAAAAPACSAPLAASPVQLRPRRSELPSSHPWPRRPRPRRHHRCRRPEKQDPPLPLGSQLSVRRHVGGGGSRHAPRSGQYRPRPLAWPRPPVEGPGTARLAGPPPSPFLHLALRVTSHVLYTSRAPYVCINPGEEGSLPLLSSTLLMCAPLSLWPESHCGHRGRHMEVHRLLARFNKIHAKIWLTVGAAHLFISTWSKCTVGATYSLRILVPNKDSKSGEIKHRSQCLVSGP